MTLNQETLIKSGAHFGHLTRRWHPNMEPFIFTKKYNTHIIDVNTTLQCIHQAGEAIQTMVAKGKKILFVATKKEIAKTVEVEAQKVMMPYVTERWLGGMLTNFITVQSSIKKLVYLDKIFRDKKLLQNYARREKLSLAREKEKLDRIFKGITHMNRLPGALFLVDAKRETIAVLEAKKLGIPVFGIVDTNTNPESVDYPIPSNDDKISAVRLITQTMSTYIQKGLDLRKQEKELVTKTKNNPRKILKPRAKNKKILKVNIQQ